MRVSFYTTYPLDKEFSWHHSFEWVEYFLRANISFKSTSNSVKLLSVQPLVAFKFISLKIADNRVNLVELTYNGVSASADIVSYTCACVKAYAPTSCMMSSTLSSSTRYSHRSSRRSFMEESARYSVREIVGMCINSPRHVHIV